MKLVDRLRLRLAKEKAEAKQQAIDNKKSITMLTTNALTRRTSSLLFKNR